MESDGQEFDDPHESCAENDGFGTSSNEEIEMQVSPPARISLSTLFARTASQGEVGSDAHPDARSSQDCGEGLDCQGVVGETAQRDLPVRHTSMLRQFLPYDASEVQEWHPNRILAAVIQFVASRVDDHNKATRPRRWRTKGFDPVVTIRSWAHSVGTGEEHVAGTWKERDCGKRFFKKVMSIACGMSQRAVLGPTKIKWKRLSHEDMYQWTRLHKIVFHEVIAPHVPELSEQRRLADAPDDPPPQKKPRTHDDDTDKTSSKTGYGFVVTLNTSLGQDDPDVIKIVQSGATGVTLRQQLKRLPVYTDAFERLWIFANNLATKYHFSTVNVTLEHSEHGDHQARVHFHFFIGIDLSSGMGFVQTPALRKIRYEEFEWNGIQPRVSPTITNRKSWGAIYQAVATGAYYVAGPKTSLIMKRSTLEPIEEHTTVAPCIYVGWCDVVECVVGSGLVSRDRGGYSCMMSLTVPLCLRLHAQRNRTCLLRTSR